MDLSIIILNYKQKGLLKQCLKGIVMAKPELTYEIIVIDNHSEDGSLAMVETMFLPEAETNTSQPMLPIAKPLVIPPIKTIAALANDGFAAGNNLGIKAAKGKYLMILNPDIALVPGTLEKMIVYLEENSKVGVLGPKLINPDGNVQDSCRRFPSLLTPLYRRTVFGKFPISKNPISHYLMKDFNHNQIIEVDWLFGACLLFRKSVLAKIGLFDERFFMYFEDLDICRRIWKAGYQVIYFPLVELVHYHHRLSAERGGIFGLFNHGGRIHFLSGLKYFAKYLGAKLPNRQAGQN